MTGGSGKRREGVVKGRSLLAMMLSGGDEIRGWVVVSDIASREHGHTSSNGCAYLDDTLADCLRGQSRGLVTHIRAV